MIAARLQHFLGIHPDELRPAGVAALFLFCVLAALMLLRPAREALGMQRGIETVRWLFIATVLVTFLLNPLFGLLVSRLRRLAFITAGYLFIVAGLLGFHALLTLAPGAIGELSGQVFYVWFSVCNLFATMMFWALMADRFTAEQAQRLFGIIAVGGTLGAIFGPWLARVLVHPLGTPALLPVAAGLLLLALAAAWRLAAIPRAPGTGSARHVPHDSEGLIGGGAWEGLRCIVRSPYLMAICAYVLIVAVMATFIYFTRLQMVAALGTDRDLRTATFAEIDMITQAATLLLQALASGHLMKRLGTATALALLPLTAALGFLGLALAGSLAALIAFEATFRAVQRGIMRPARETLFTVVSRAERYKAKSFIDTFVYRSGDVAGAQTEGALTRLGMGLAALTAFAVPLALIWMALGIWLGRMQRSRMAAVTDPGGATT